MITVIKPGSKVRLIKPDIEGIVLSIRIPANEQDIEYEVAWWSGEIRKCEWVSQFEVARTKDSAHKKIGFNEH